MGYVGLHRQRRLRENMRVALVTKLKPDMIFTRAEQLHWFGITDPNPRLVLATKFLSVLRVARQLLRQARSWIEATQSYDRRSFGTNS